MKKSFLLATVAAGMMIFTSSCLDNGSGGTTPSQSAFLMANLSPDATPVNVKLNSDAYASGFFYGAYTAYNLLTAGSYTIAFSDASNNTVLSNTINMEANKYYSYYLIDSFHEVKSAFMEDNIIRPSADSVYIRFFNFSPNVGTVNLHDSVNKVDWYASRNFNDQVGVSSYTAFNRIPQGVYTLQLTNPLDSALVSRKDTLAGGHVYTIFAKGFSGGTGSAILGIGQIQNY